MRNVWTIAALALLSMPAFSAGFKPHPASFQPRPAAGLRAYVIGGVPIAAVDGDSSFALLSLQAGRVGSTDYVRLFLLYQNLSAEPFLFEPGGHVKLTVETDRVALPGLLPASPSQLAKDIDRADETGAIHARYSGALRSAAAAEAPEAPAPPRIDPYDAADPAAAAAADEAARARIRGPSHMYQTFINSDNSGLLRRATVFPGRATSGNVYVAAPGADLRKCRRITVYLTTNDGIRAVEFAPLAGE